MSKTSRREFLAFASTAAAVLRSSLSFAKRTESSRAGIPMIHATDLFRPFNDPDDHWDLACVYALAYRGDIDLKAIVIDFPLPGKKADTAAIAQLNLITGLNIPAVVGCPLPMKSRNDTQPQAGPGDHKAIEKVLEILRSSPEKVVINVTGCCRDIALAGKKDPALFKEKCSAIYLNAGAAITPPNAKLEYNVGLDKASYAAVFDLPCPIYWMPCFHQMHDPWHVRQFGTFYKFKQSKILPHLSEQMQKYFA
ncbi:MAG: nucleoside hydrolase, partial [Planctomycetota bacterium]